MAEIERVTVTLPHDLVRDIDRREKNRSKFIAEAVRRWSWRRRVEHYTWIAWKTRTPESVEFAEQGLDEWTRGLPDEDTATLVNSNAGKGVRWVPGEGWLETTDMETDAETNKDQRG